MLTLDAFESLMNKTKKINLTVNSGDEGAEIFILDSQYKRIAVGTGPHMEFKLEPGVYTVKVRAGSDYREQAVVLYKNQKLDFEPIEFSAPAPIEGTGKTHEYHVGNAEVHSKKIHLSVGKGSQIYLFVRDWTSKKESPEIETLKRTPAKGLKLCDSKGKELVNLEMSSDKEIRWDPWAACNIEVKPGNYRLQLRTETGNILEQTIVASPRWQTQVFLLVRDYGFKKKDLRADISGASIFMARSGEGFKPQKRNTSHPEKPDLRLSELARQALLNDRSRLCENIIQQTIKRKFVNPMMGIYGAHLMLRNKEYDANLVKFVIDNLRNLFETPHPDVEALALKANIDSNYVFDTPPMLRSSWAYILEASCQKPGLVPENSIATQVTRNLWSEGIWLVWGRYGEQTDADKADNDKILFDQLKKLTQLEASSIDTSNLAPDQLMAAKKTMPFDAGDADILSMPQSTRSSWEHDVTSCSLLRKTGIIMPLQSGANPFIKL